MSKSAVKVQLNPIINVLKGINPDGTLAVNNGEFFDVVCVDAIVFEVGNRRFLNPRILIAADSGKLRSAAGFADEIIQSGTMPTGGGNDGYDGGTRPSNQLSS
jgi:hypothetical protein